MPTDPVTAAPERLPGVDEPALTIDLGFGRWMIDRGTYADVPCLYLEPAPVPGPPLERAPEFTSIRQLLPGSVCITFGTPEALTFLRWWLARLADPEGTPDDPAAWKAAFSAPSGHLPRATGENAEGGWTLPVGLIQEVQDEAQQRSGYSGATLEETEQVMLETERRIDAAAVPPAPADIVALVQAYGNAVVDACCNEGNGARAARDALLDAIGRMGQADWRPIESAPKNGTPILVARDMRSPWDWVLGTARWDGARGIYGWIARGVSDPPGELGLGAPTHWQPLPSHPGAAPPPPPAGEPVEPSPDALRAALRPFAAAADDLDDDHADASPIWETAAAMGIDAGDLRRAAAALTAPAPAAAVTRPSLEEARTAARAWIEAYGINTERYTRHGGDHPMMETLPEAFQAYAAAQAVAAVARPSLEEVTKLVDAARQEVVHHAWNTGDMDCAQRDLDARTALLTAIAALAAPAAQHPAPVPGDLAEALTPREIASAFASQMYGDDRPWGSFDGREHDALLRGARAVLDLLAGRIAATGRAVPEQASVVGDGSLSHAVTGQTHEDLRAIIDGPNPPAECGTFPDREPKAAPPPEPAPEPQASTDAVREARRRMREKAAEEALLWGANGDAIAAIERIPDDDDAALYLIGDA